MSKRQTKGPEKARIRPKVRGGGKNAMLEALGKFRKIAECEFDCKCVSD